MSHNIKPIVFLILSGWGIAPASSANAISLAKTPNFDRLTTNYKTFSLKSSGNAVGLLDREPGNSRTGYLSIGTGKVVYEMLPKINIAIKDRTFFDNKAFLLAIENCIKNDSAMHLIGQVSENEKHSSLKHLFALLDLVRSKKINKVYLHLVLDGLLADREEGLNQIEKIQEHLEKNNSGKIASIHGQYYAMNRDGFWDKTEKSYKVIVNGKSDVFGSDASTAIKKSYSEKIYDAEIIPTVITEAGKPVGKVEDNDSIISFNFSSDRTRQLVRAFVDPEFKKFKTKKLDNVEFVGMVKYCHDIDTKFAFEEDEIKTSLPSVLDNKHIKQLYITEADRHIQLVSFLRGNLDEKLENTTDIIMAESKIAKAVVQNIVDEKRDFIGVNFSMADKTADDGNLKKTIKEVEKIDSYIGKIVDAVVGKGGVVFIASDHGNIEEFASLQSGEVEKENTTNPTPFILIGEKWGQDKELGKGKIDLSLLEPIGVLVDIAPTILKIMGIKKPKEMTGKSLI